MLTNQLLIAMPELSDPLFFKAVVYVCEHNEDGAVGIIINRPTDYPFSFVFDQLNIKINIPGLSSQPVLFGGPVQQDRGFVIHRPSKDFEAGIHLSDSVCISTSKENLQQLVSGSTTPEMLLALGCAGWEASQLDDEILNNAWLNCPVTDKLIYNTRYEDRWEEAIKSLGIDVKQLASGSGHA